MRFSVFSALLPVLLIFLRTWLMIAGKNGLIDRGIGNAGSAWAEILEVKGIHWYLKKTFIMFTN